MPKNNMENQLLSIAQINENLSKLKDWNLEDNGKSIVRFLELRDFNEAVEFINKIKEIAETEGHHPDLRLFNYNNLEITLTSHSAHGLTKKDFDVAEKIDKL